MTGDKLKALGIAVSTPESAIDFWSLWRKKQGLDLGFVPTVTELVEMLF